MSIILVIATHPDDEVLGCGGVMARHSTAGDQVHVLVVTRGAEELFPDSLIAETREELRKAHAILNVTSVSFLDFPAPKLASISGHLVADAISAHIRRLQPDILYIPHQGDLHYDHKATYWAALVAARPNGSGYPSRILCYETPSETEWGAPSHADSFVPTVFADISGHLKAKLNAMACYRTQLKEPPHSRSLKAIEALAVYRGATVCVAAAEAFMLVRDVQR